MKKMLVITMLTIVLSGLFSFTSATAGSPVSSSLRQKIAESIVFPDAILGSYANTTVDVVFSLTSDGKIEIKDVKTDDTKLATFVKEKISAIRISDLPDCNTKYYKIKLTFQTP
jgi:hypothetical protein